MPTDPHPLALNPDALARFGRLELLAKTVVEGLMAGRHRSPFKGFSVEFAEHRPYGPGDEIRHIDWRTFGKTDRYYIKEYEQETNLKAVLVVDTSASMAYAGAHLAKIEAARRLAASLAYLMIGQRDAVGLLTTSSGPETMIPPRAVPAQLALVCAGLDAASPAGETPPSHALHALAERWRRRGMVAIFSDGFEPVDALADAVRHLRHRRHEVVFFHILAPEESDLPFRRPTRFRDLERPARSVLADPSALRPVYRQRFAAFLAELKGRLRTIGADYHLARTDQPTTQILLDYLADRAGRPTGGGGAQTP